MILGRMGLLLSITGALGACGPRSDSILKRSTFGLSLGTSSPQHASPTSPDASNGLDAPLETGGLTFMNPVQDSGADPWVVRWNGSYYRVYSDADASIWVSSFEYLEEMRQETAVKIWEAPPGMAYSEETWAPEMHLIDGHWYIYLAASDGDNNHHMFVLESATDDPKSAYIYKDRLAHPVDRWAIDGTIFTHTDGRRYMIWSGWDGTHNVQQNLYIAPLLNPWTLATGRESFGHYEAEAAVISHAQVHANAYASGGQAVGMIDYADSGVTFTIPAAVTGVYQLDVRYSNGTSGTSSYLVTLDNEVPQTLLLPSTVSWENWQTASMLVNLPAGTHTLRLEKAHSYAELDAIEVKLSGSDRLVISHPTEEWERRGGPPYVNEGPQILHRKDKVFLVYAASASWTDDYGLGLISFSGDNPMNPASWQKIGQIFNKTRSVFGPGHCSFTQSLDGSEDWLVYHAARFSGSGFDRTIRIQKFDWDAEDRPVFGLPVSAGVPLAIPKRP